MTLRDPELESMFGHYIDFSKPPKIPLGWSIHKEDQIRDLSRHYLRHKDKWKFDQAEVGYWQVQTQKEDLLTTGDYIAAILMALAVAGPQLLYFYLEHQDLIPTEWHDFNLLAWGVIFRNDKNQKCVQCLFKNGKRWYLGHRIVDNELTNNYRKTDVALIHTTPRVK